MAECINMIKFSNICGLHGEECVYDELEMKNLEDEEVNCDDFEPA